MYKDILRYMGYKGDADIQMNNLIASCIEKINKVSTPRYVKQNFVCKIENNNVKIDTLAINSTSLASHLSDSDQAYLFAATLGADVDRIISQRSIIDSAEALCLQACAVSKIEEYCDNIEKEIKDNAEKHKCYITSRFSPGYGDFSIEYQKDILRMLNAQKQIGVTVTKSHILSPLKTVTAIIGIINNTSLISAGSCNSWTKKNNCDICDKTDCEFRVTKGKNND